MCKDLIESQSTLHNYIMYATGMQICLFAQVYNMKQLLLIYLNFSLPTSHVSFFPTPGAGKD